MRKDEWQTENTRAKGVQEFFERVATDRDTMRLAYYDERVIEGIAKVSGVNDGMTVADVGTGRGFVAAGIALRTRRVLAVDNSPAMLEVARKHLGELGINNVELLGDVSALPVESSSADATFANMVHHHAEHPVAMHREMARVTKPGGAGRLDRAGDVARDGVPRSGLREELPMIV